MAARLVIRQPGTDDGGDFWNEWHCEPPPPGTPFTVTRARWAEDDGDRIRQIFRVELSGDGEPIPPQPAKHKRIAGTTAATTAREKE